MTQIKNQKPESVKSNNPCQSVIQTGYKQTEVGVIPEEWGVDCIGNAFEICNHLRLPISQAVRERMNGPYPYYGPTNVQGYINEYRVDGEYALIGEDGDHFLKWRDQSMTLLVKGKFNVNNHAHIIRGTKNLTEWFYWYFAHNDLTPHLSRQGAGRFKLNKKTLIQIPCAIPPLPEQRAIATALSDVDALIASLDKLITKKRDMKQAAMQELLTGKRRLPGFSGEWEVKRLGEVCPLQRGFDLPISQLRPGSFPVVYSNGVMNHHASYMVKGPGVVTGRSGTIGNVHYVTEDYWPHNTSLWVTSYKGNSPIFVFYLLTFIGLDKFGTGSGVPTLNRNDVHEHKAIIPSTEAEQTAIAAILSDMDTEIASLEQKRDKTRLMKQGMMQELLTGRIRLV